MGRGRETGLLIEDNVVMRNAWHDAELLWETGAAQSDAANFTAEDIDWQTRTISYFRQKTGSLAQFTISKALEKVLQQLPMEFAVEAQKLLGVSLEGSVG